MTVCIQLIIILPRNICHHCTLFLSVFRGKMQTFLAYALFLEALKCLDNKRLGKQRSEVRVAYGDGDDSALLSFGSYRTSTRRRHGRYFIIILITITVSTILRFWCGVGISTRLFHITMHALMNGNHVVSIIAWRSYHYHQQPSYFRGGSDLRHFIHLTAQIYYVRIEDITHLMDGQNHLNYRIYGLYHGRESWHDLYQTPTWCRCWMMINEPRWCKCTR